MADMAHDTTDDMKHREFRPNEILRSKKCTRRTLDAVHSFINPFDFELKKQLVIQSSGATASADITQDVLQAEEAGKEAKDESVESRLKQSKDFLQPVKRLNLKALGDLNKKVKVTTCKRKVLQYKQGNVAF